MRSTESFIYISRHKLNYAYAADQEERIESGTRVVVLEHEAARTVIVSPLS